jgi:hypothetical protein
VGRSFNFCAVLVVRCGPIFELGRLGGSCSAAPELFRRLSLLFKADNGAERVDCGVFWTPDAIGAIVLLPPVAVGCCCGNAGLRRGGLAVEICGLNVTLRLGLDATTGRGAVSVGRSGEDSDAP